ncbi:synaptonemal complex protein 2 isoform X2 [Gadus morhua]|uniref:synaptonemal complex protein 2 isoform X2 n=1 Tax=Gadus morhua TaxID=8049 RepID=UPI0011B4558E|nr:synaptonemal complex protein 2 isoform X2 [Gadus morhua]
MAPGQDQQLEKLVDEALRSSRFQRLDLFLEEDSSQCTTIKCSKQFLVKVDKLVNRCLDQKATKHASLCLSILYKCCKKLSFPGDLGPSEIIAQGFVKKMVDWFEKCRQLWIKRGPKRDEDLLTLAEDFFDSLMAVHEISKEATYQVTDIFLHPIGQLATNPTIYILIKKEAIRKFNMVLDKMPEELKKEKNFSSEEASDVMTKLAGQILEGGDYDFQTALMEALCRMATPGQRRAMVHRWFSMDYVAKAFIAIRDSEFETDCRTFLNLVNGMQGDNRRVFSYPCLEAFLDKHELLMPSDEKLEEFWIDFNLGSQSISFYFAVADEETKEGQWDTICITENEVHSYTIKEDASCHVLRLKLCEVLCVGNVEGNCLTVRFSPALAVMHAVRAVYGDSKNRRFVGKSSTVKTTVKILMDDSCSQPAVPESQVSLTTDRNVEPSWAAPPAGPVQLITPARRRVSESYTFISGSAGGSVRDSSPYSVVLPANTPSSWRENPALQNVRGAERPGPYHPGEPNAAARTPSSHRTTPSSARAEHLRNQTGRSVIPSERSRQKVKGAQEDDLELLENSFVPDSQPVTKSRGSTISNWHKQSMTDMLMMPIQRNRRLSRPESEGSLGRQLEPPPSVDRAQGSGSELYSHKRLHLELSQRLQEVINQISLDSEGEEPAGPRGKGPPADRGGPQKGREPAVRCPPSLRATAVAPPPPKAGVPGLTSRKRRGQSAPEPGVAKETSATRKAAPAKVLQDRTLNPKVKPAGTASAKEKKDSELADSMVKLISSRYNSTPAGISKLPSAERSVVTSDRPPLSWVPQSFNKSNLERSWLPSGQKGTGKAADFNKSHCNPMKLSTGSRGDIFSFRDDGSTHIGGKPGEPALESSSSMLSSRSLSSKKAPPEPKGKRHVTKHLFSDTDTDRTRTGTDVSWLRESSRKPKPKVTDYTRKAPAKTVVQAPDTTYESPDLPLPSAQKDTVRPLQRPLVKAAGERPERQAAVPSRAAPAAGRRPQRAAATQAKSYRDPDSDDSHSGVDQPPAAKKHPSVEQQAKRERATEKTRTSLPYKRTNQKIERNGRDSLTDKELPAPSKKCTTGRRVKNEETCPIKPPEATRPSKTNQGPHVQSEADQSPGPQKQAGKRAFQGAGETKRGGPGLRPNEQISVQKASWTTRLASRSPCLPPVEKMRSATTMTPAPAISPLSPLGSPRPAFPDGLHPRGRGTPKPPRPVAPGNGVSKGAAPPPGGPRKKGSAPALPLRFLPPHPPVETPVGRPAAQRAPRRGGVSELSPISRPLLSAPRSPLSLCSQASQPMLTSTALDADKSPAPYPACVQLSPACEEPSPATGDDPHDHAFHYGSSKVSPVSCLTQSSSMRSSIGVFKVEVNTRTVLEKTPTSTRKQKPIPRHHHVSGPTLRNAETSSSGEDEEEQMLKKKGKRTRQRSPKMKPRKLFKSSTKVQVDSQISEIQLSSEEEEEEEEEKSPGFKSGPKDYQADIKSKSCSRTTHNTALKVPPQDGAGRVASSTHTRITREWAAELDDEDKENEDPGDEEDEDQEDEDQEDQELADDEANDPGHVGNVCQQFSSKLQKKLQGRSRRMERYGRQSAQTALRHVTHFGAQVNKYRTQHLEQVRLVLHEEITQLEQGESTLKHMEKELNVYWRKQSTAFHSYQEKEKRRHQRLKDTLQNNKTYSLDHEGKLFTSQMGLMRKDLKCVQDGLFKEMQEEEIHSVRRGLQSLFMPETALF